MSALHVLAFFGELVLVLDLLGPDVVVVGLRCGVVPLVLARFVARMHALEFFYALEVVEVGCRYR